MSLTSPITTLTLGQDAPMPNRSSTAPSSNLPLLDHTAPVCFFGAFFGSGPITSLTNRSTRTLPPSCSSICHSFSWFLNSREKTQECMGADRGLWVHPRGGGFWHRNVLGAGIERHCIARTK